jgi:hypothetical protein
MLNKLLLIILFLIIQSCSGNTTNAYQTANSFLCCYKTPNGYLYSCATQPSCLHEQTIAGHTTSNNK